MLSVDYGQKNVMLQENKQSRLLGNFNVKIHVRHQEFSKLVIGE